MIAGDVNTSTGQTREASAQCAVRRRRKRLEFVSAKRVQTPLQGVCTTIERTDVGSSPTVTTKKPLKFTASRVLLCSFLKHFCHHNCHIFYLTYRLSQSGIAGSSISHDSSRDSSFRLQPYCIQWSQPPGLLLNFVL